MSDLNVFLNKKLTDLKEKNLLRQLRVSSANIDFSSNDYLGLASSEKLSEQIIEKTASLQHKKNGATGSRLLTGNSSYIEAVEQKLSNLFKSESTLIFNSGYAANLAVLSSVPQRGDTVLYDELCHASIKDGLRLSLCTRHSFRHNDVIDLETKLKKIKERKFIVVESIYSMDGDQCLLAEIVSIAKRHNAIIILDEAHSTGTVGPLGSGVAVAEQLHQDVDIRIYTFGKAMGVHGACVCGSRELISYLINFARPFIYTTALPPHSIASIDCAFQFLESNFHLQNQLQEIVNHYAHEQLKLFSTPPRTTAIQTFVLPGNENVKSAASFLQQHGLDVRPILSPTVKAGGERLRICLHSYNTKDEISLLMSKLHEIANSKH